MTDAGPGTRALQLISDGEHFGPQQPAGTGAPAGVKQELERELKFGKCQASKSSKMASSTGDLSRPSVAVPLLALAGNDMGVTQPRARNKMLIRGA